MNTIAKYQNGNLSVTIAEDGTKIREYEGTPMPLFPESIDVKITDYCDMNCLYCHESSTTKGKHGNLERLLDVLKELPSGVELAIGGGNPLAHPDLIWFLNELQKQGIIANITVNQGHLKQYEDLLEYLINDNLVKGVGVSITSNNFQYVKLLKEKSNNIVYHVIAGVNKVEIMDTLMQIGNAKVLVLGYKRFGFGEAYFSDEVKKEITRWFIYLPKYIEKCVLSFDNLAIEQLHVKRLFTQKGWDKFYMGNDFCFTMYIDAVKEKFAPTSRSSDRKSFEEHSLIEYFNTFRNK